ncbi:MAG: electron transfer flavoprotein subunit alpha [Elusimicrobiaceae bacterium]|nr:electron transfer flavoprotein subunit alpha [Elusimicrobiaceae bacterium]
MIQVGANCVGCGKCVSTCPFGALSLVNRKAVANASCTMCGACVSVCPVKALSLPAAGAVKKDLSAYKGVWAFIEITDDGKTQKVRPVGFELLSKGRELADQLGEELAAVVIGDGVEKYFAELSSYGADKIYSVSSPAYHDYNTAAYANAMVQLIKKYNPSVVLYPSTYIGRDLSPRISSELFVGLTADCTGLSIADGLLIQTRPAFGGNIMADIKCPDYRPQMSTVRPNVFKKVVTRPGSMAQVVNEVIPVAAAAGKVRIISKHFDEASTQEKLDEAEVVLAGGRGLKDAAGFALLEELAQELGGAVGASRAAIDLGLKPKEKQIGQSGVTVAAKLYVACGISGAVQHVVGMEHSDVIIGINKDANAPIFNVCKYGFVGDARQLLPKVVEAVKKAKQK